MALGANSPFLFGKELWRETRIALFEQATDTRPQELKAQGVRPRVWFGERWITSVFDQFEENVRYFPALLPVCDDEDPVAVLDRGDIPAAGRAADAQRDHLPLEPAGVRRPPRQAAPAGREPGAARRADRRRRVRQRARSTTACCGRSPTQDRPVWSQMSFAAAEDNFEQGARHGINAQLYWPGLGDRARSPNWCCARLLPMAQQGLAAWGVDAAVSDRLLGDHRAPLHRPSATARSGRRETFHRIDEQKQPLDRRDALREMLHRYVEHMHTNEPVDDWPID